MSTITQDPTTDVITDDDIDQLLENNLVVHNDDHNTFEWVIECFMLILDHKAVQAEQCAYIIHTKGKCSVKSGSMDELKPLKDGLIDKGLNATIE
jgi:ATP-dependent Clp protease adaptor protein ClpS